MSLVEKNKRKKMGGGGETKTQKKINKIRKKNEIEEKRKERNERRNERKQRRKGNENTNAGTLEMDDQEEG